MRLITLPALLLLATIAPRVRDPVDDGMAAYKSGATGPRPSRS